MDQSLLINSVKPLTTPIGQQLSRIIVCKRRKILNRLNASIAACVSTASCLQTTRSKNGGSSERKKLMSLTPKPPPSHILKKWCHILDVPFNLATTIDHVLREQTSSEISSGPLSSSAIPFFPLCFRASKPFCEPNVIASTHGFCSLYSQNVPLAAPLNFGSTYYNGTQCSSRMIRPQSYVWKNVHSNYARRARRAVARILYRGGGQNKNVRGNTYKFQNLKN